MTNTFVKSLVAEQDKEIKNNNKTITTNGAKAFKSTLNANLDLHSAMGSFRKTNDEKITKLLDEALNEDLDTALRNLLLLRDVRGGLGEREAFRKCLQHLYHTNYKVLVNSNFLELVPVVGRWDDLLVFINPIYNTEIKQKIANMFKKALLEDKNGLCSKWTPRQGPVAGQLRTLLGWTPKFYRKTLVGLTNVVETTMCKGKPAFKEINFNHVPSRAFQIYKDAFNRNAVDEFKKWKESLVNDTGDAKINAGAVFPYQVLKQVNTNDASMSAVFEKQWESLPNYVTPGVNVLPMIDVSGSMDCPSGAKGFTCMDMSISLGIYLSTKMTGDFKDVYMTFAERPKLTKLVGKTLKDKYEYVESHDVGYSTNVEAAFREIVNFAKNNKVKQEDMPKYLVMFSDMQFNQADRGNKSGFGMMKKAFNDAGYEIPKIIFWNLNAAYSNNPVTFDKKGTALVSGFSPALMKSIFAGDLKSEDFTPLAIMNRALQVDRYTITYN